MKVTRSLVLVVLSGLLAASAARANFGLFRGMGFGTHTSSSYYAPVTVYYYEPAPAVCVPYAWPVAPVIAAPAPRPAAPAPAPSSAEPPRLYAPPSAAPPSAPAEPSRPAVSESRKAGAPAYDTYYVGTAGAAGPNSSCDVVFWNHSGQPLTLTVEGREHRLPAGGSLRLALKHEFTWEVAGREPQRQRVPPQETGLEIVLRG